jgi:hypothetical protein
MFSKCYNKGLGIPVPESARIIPIVPEALGLIGQQILRETKRQPMRKSRKRGKRGKVG